MNAALSDLIDQGGNPRELRTAGLRSLEDGRTPVKAATRLLGGRRVVADLLVDVLDVWLPETQSRLSVWRKGGRMLWGIWVCGKVCFRGCMVVLTTVYGDGLSGVQRVVI